MTPDDADAPLWHELEELEGGRQSPAVPASVSTEHDPEQLSSLMRDVERLAAQRDEFEREAAAEPGTVLGAPSEPEPPKPTERRADAPNWWWRTPPEILAVFGCAALVEMLLRDGRVGALGIQPHPYWLPVLIIAASRGAVAALLAGLAAGALYAIGVHQTVVLDGLAGLFSLQNLLEPVLFLAVGFVIGEIRDALATRHDELCAKYEVLHHQRHALLADKALLAQVNSELKRRLFDDSRQFGNLIDSLVRGEVGSDNSAYELALDMVVEHCGATRCSILLVLEEWTLDLAGHRGWEQGNIRRRLDEAITSEQVQRAIHDAERVCTFTAGSAAAWLGPLAVAPIADSNGVVMALLCLDELPVKRLNEATISTFYGIADWLGARLKQIARNHRPIDVRTALSRLSNSEPWLGGVDDLGARLRLEDARCGRHGIHTSMIAVQALEFDSDDAGIRARLDDLFRKLFEHDLRFSDYLYSFGYLGCYVVVLAGTNADGAEIVRQRLARRLQGLVAEGVGRVQVRCFAPTEDVPRLAELLDAIAEHFRAGSSVPLQRECPVRIPAQPPLGNLIDFELRMRLEILLARRYRKDLSIVDIRAGDAPGSGATVLRHLTDGSVTMLRATDGLYQINEHRCAVVLPATGCDFAFLLWQRMTDFLRQRLPEPRFEQVQMEVMALDLDDPEEMLGHLIRSHLEMRTDP